MRHGECVLCPGGGGRKLLLACVKAGVMLDGECVLGPEGEGGKILLVGVGARVALNGDVQGREPL